MNPYCRDPARAALRAVHHRFLAAWSRGLAPGTGEEAGVVYVDAFAGGDLHRAPGAGGGALPVVDALGALPAHAGALLLEEDPARVRWIEEALRSSPLAARPSGHGATDPLRPGEIRVREGGPGDLPAAVAGPSYRLYHLAPPAPDRLPLETVLSLLDGGDADALVRFPVEGLRVLARHRGTPLADLPPLVKRAVDGYSRLLGDDRHRWVFAWRAALEEGGAEAAERAVVERCAARLGRSGAEGVVKWVAVRGAGGEGPAYLLLAVRDAASALLLNGALHEARREGLVHDPSPVALDLFGAPAARERRTDPLALAHGLATRYAGRTVPYRQVLADHAHTELLAADLRRALAALRREGRALYGALDRPDAPIAFPRAGAAVRRPVHRRAGGRGGEGTLSFSFATEE